MNHAHYTQFGGMAWNTDALQDETWYVDDVTPPAPVNARVMDNRDHREIIQQLYADTVRLTADVVYLRGLVGTLMEDVKALTAWRLASEGDHR